MHLPLLRLRVGRDESIGECEGVGGEGGGNGRDGEEEEWGEGDETHHGLCPARR